jgi:hypothetical protein
MVKNSQSDVCTQTASQAALMIFVLDTAVGLGVWLPFTFGKSTALLSVSPRLHFPESPT